METGAITANSTSVDASKGLISSRIERNAALDTANEERRTGTASVSDQPAENRPELSETGLRLATSYLLPTNVTAKSSIENNIQAQKATHEIANVIQKIPHQAIAAQSNLTSNVVKSLLG